MSWSWGPCRSLIARRRHLGILRAGIPVPKGACSGFS